MSPKTTQNVTIIGYNTAMIYWIIGGGLACVILGVVIGYRACSFVEGHVFQALVESGQIVVRTEDGWQGEKTAFEEIGRMVIRK